MSNREKFLWCMYAGVLALLFLMSSTDLIIKEKKAEILQISVIIEDAGDDYYINYKKGMDKAAEEFLCDVNFITLYRTNDHEQQMELVQREIRDGAKAVILSPVNESNAVMALEQLKPGCPIILLGVPVPSEYVADTISLDGYGMGEMAAKAVIKQAPQEVPVYLFTEGILYGDNADVYDGVRSALEEQGFTCRLVERKDDDTYRKVIEETVYPGDGQITIVAMDTPSLDQVARILEGSTVYQDHVSGLYGIGSTTAILNSVDRGIIRGIAAYSQFNQGYLSVKRAVEAIQGSRQGQHIKLPAVYIHKENLRDKQYEKMFYPIE